MTSPRDALRTIEAGAYADAGAGDMDAQDAFRRFEIEQMNTVAAEETRARNVLGVTALLMLVYVFGNPRSKK
ncbi:MAG: hypothetical protein EKK55_21835 [Rhodocyclaceae bacterium]|nr:MAG: hypothetical protein EKK55_21835 [Rhodocyclaceae bacterium]